MTRFLDKDSAGKRLEKLNYLIGFDESYRFSLAPSDSDYSPNQNLLDHLVSTMVKYGKSGHPEPYLAERWETKDHGHRWEFFIRPGLKCEDGTAITARGYHENLLRSLRRYSQSTRVMDFDLLKGWAGFASQNTDQIEGIVSAGSQITFTFDRAPENFLDTLRKVYFGFWCEANFDGDRWVGSNKFVSSGSYAVAKVEAEGKSVTLRRRPNWFSVSDESPAEIRFGALDPSKIDPNEINIVSVTLRPPVPMPEGVSLMKSTPSWLGALVLGHKKNGFFADRANRQAFGQRIKKALSSLKSEILTPTDAFYPVNRRGVGEGTSNVSYPAAGSGNVTFLLSRSVPANDAQGIRRAITESLPPGRTAVFAEIDRTKPDWESIYAPEKFDAHMQIVDVGGFISLTAIKMMFCTSLGVQFPDQSGKICGLTSRYEAKDKLPDDEFERSFNSILEFEADVVPLFHTGLHYLYSKKIDPESICPSLITPRLDLLRAQP